MRVFPGVLCASAIFLGFGDLTSSFRARVLNLCCKRCSLFSLDWVSCDLEAVFVLGGVFISMSGVFRRLGSSLIGVVGGLVRMSLSELFVGWLSSVRVCSHCHSFPAWSLVRLGCHATADIGNFGFSESCVSRRQLERGTACV